MMRQRKSKKILIYFFLFLFFGSINNINFNNFKIDKIASIQVSGLEDKYNRFLVQQLNNLNLGNILFLNESKISKIIDSNSFIESYSVFKSYPSTLYVDINKTIFLAKINKEGKIFLIGSNGKLSDSNLSDKDLPFIFGNPEVKNFLEFKRIIDDSTLSYNQIKSFYFFQSMRWDIELDNNIILKLSENDTKNSLKDAILFLNNSSFKDIKIIDARIKDKIIIVNDQRI
tara:strand:- start:1170 stop:1856 length:687 start_codon:yes stop_codon:yes gene_type:complete